MDIQTLTQGTGLLVALAPAFIVFGAIWIVWRTESMHVLRRRLWLLIHGSQDISDPAIRAFVEEQSSLTAFRMFSGIRVNSVEDAQQLIEWAKVNAISLRTISGCGDYFDAELRIVKTQKLPRRWVQRALGVLAATGFFAVMIFVCATSFSKVAFTFKSDQRWFLADQSSARALWPLTALFSDPLRQVECQKLSPTTEEQKFFRPDQLKMLCELLGDEKWSEYFTSRLREQRLASLMLFAVTALLTYLLASSRRRIVVARTLALRRVDPSLSGSQLTLGLWP